MDTYRGMPTVIASSTEFCPQCVTNQAVAYQNRQSAHPHPYMRNSDIPYDGGSSVGEARCDGKRGQSPGTSFPSHPESLQRESYERKSETTYDQCLECRSTSRYSLREESSTQG